MKAEEQALILLFISYYVVLDFHKYLGIINSEEIDRCGSIAPAGGSRISHSELRQSFTEGTDLLNMAGQRRYIPIAIALALLAPPVTSFGLRSFGKYYALLSLRKL